MRNFKGLVFTNHALQRLSERGIKQGDVWATWRNPDQTRYAKNKGAWVYYKTWPASSGEVNDTKIEVVAKQNEKKEWIVLSVWSKKVFRKKKNRKSILSLLVDKLFKKKA